MAIKRLQIPEGAPIWGPTKPHNLAVRLWKERSSDIDILKPGDYDVTPEPHREKIPNANQLTVLEDGTALFRVYAIGRTALTKLNMRGQGSIDQLPEGRGDLLHIPQDKPGRLVLGDRPERVNKGRLFLFDVIIWSPDTEIDIRELTTSTSLDLDSELINSSR